MKMVKSLLLGSAASFVAIAGAQAADLPVKAKPVEYVKVCSLYGAGFFYIPGTDTCIKLGGAVRVQAEANMGAGGIPVGIGNTTEAAQGALTRSATNDINWRTRIYFSTDARQQTEYGTLRTYFRFGIQQTTPADTVGGAIFWDRAFIQFAGFTVGKTLSFFDGTTLADFNYNNPRTMADTGPNGIQVWAYTAQFGNGVSATLSAEDPNARGKIVVNAANPPGDFGLATAIVNSNGLAASSGGNGMLFPDVIGALRVDQAWGSAQVMAALHDVSGSYYGTDAKNNPLNTTGHPANAYGWAVGGALTLNLPSFGATSNVNSQPNVDQLKLQAAYGKGATGFTTNANGVSTIYNGNSKVAAAWLYDGIYSTGTTVELTTSWSVTGAYQHLWTPNWRTSVYGGYLGVQYDNTASAEMCASSVVNFSFLTPQPASCAGTFDYHVWQVGSRTQWNPVSQLDVGVDVLYSKLGTAAAGSLITQTATVGAHPAGIYTLADQDVLSVMFRVQRNFWP